MSQDHYPDCVYFDKNIISMVVGHPKLYRPLFNFLFENHLCIAVSDALFIELSQETVKQADFNTFFTLLPSAKIKSFEAVIEEEVKSYPKTRTDASLLWPADSKFSKENITSWLIPDKIEEGQIKQLLHAKKMRQYLESVNSNFPPPNLGKFNKEQTEFFAWMLTAQWLRGSHPQFMKKLNEKRRLLKGEAFPSIQLLAYYVYYKCYLGNRQSKALSDFSDLFHLFYFPYCKLIILETDMYDILNKIKSDSKMLDSVEVTNMDFFNNGEKMAS
jgi:hypothetical protein